MDHEQRIRTVCAKHFDVDPERVSIVKRLMGGMSNYTYAIDVNGVPFTFRIPGKNAHHFVDRKVEAFHLPIVESWGISNETVHLDVETGEKIGVYVHGKPMSEDEPFNHVKDVAELLKGVHESGFVTPFDYSPLARLYAYESLIYAYGYSHNDQYANLKRNWRDLISKYGTHPTVFTHGDPQPSNFVITKNGLRLVDWEFTANNDPFYDIAQFGNMNFDHALELLEAYLDEAPTTEDYNRLYFWRMFQCLQWHNVAWYKHIIGLSEELGIDFKKVAAMYLDKATAMRNSLK